MIVNFSIQNFGSILWSQCFEKETNSPNKPHLKTAISHATALGNFDTQAYKGAMCEMPLLLELVYVDNE